MTSSEYPWVTTMGNTSYNEVVTATILPPMANVDVALSEIARTIPLVDPEVLTLKHNAFIAALGKSGTRIHKCQILRPYCSVHAAL